MSDKPMTPSERAAKAITETFELHEWGGKSDVLWDTKQAAAIIARETGCDQPDPARDIVRQVQEWMSYWENQPTPMTLRTCDGHYLKLKQIMDAAALHAAGGE